MALTVAQGALVRLIWTVSGTPVALNVVGIKRTAGTAVDQSFADAVGLFVKNSFTASGLTAAIGSSVALAQVGVRDVNTASQPEHLDANPAVPGAAAGALLPPQVALCVTLRTALAGKEYRGRYYQFGYTAGSLTAGGACLQAHADLTRAFIDQLRTTLSTNGLPLQVMSRKLNVGSAVTLVQVRDAVFDTIRKRAVPGV